MTAPPVSLGAVHETLRDAAPGVMGPAMDGALGRPTLLTTIM